MNVKSIRKLTAIVAVLLIAVLATTLAIFFNSPLSARAEEDLYDAQYIGTNGELPDVEGGHRTGEAERAYMQSKHSLAEGGALLAIDSGEKLFNFLNGLGAEANYGHAYLTANVGIAYSNASSEAIYDFKTSDSNSKSIFDKVFDGNGYTVSIFGGTADYSDIYAEQTDDYYTIGNATYRYHGYLVAINRGTIENVTVDYSSAHGRVSITASTNNGSNFEQDDMTAGSGLFSQANLSASTVAGIVTGQNGDGGVIDNVRLNVRSNFKVVDRQGSAGYFIHNSAIVGGIAGRVCDGSLLTNTQVDISGGAGIYGACQGRTVSIGNTGAGVAIVGGLVGRIDKGAGVVDGVLRDGKVEYCAVTGNGEVKATVGRANETKNQFNEAYRYSAYSGGAVGACVDIQKQYDNIFDGGENSTTKHAINDGQIRGIISSWKGTIQNNFSNNNRTVSGQLFGSIGSNVASCAVLYDLVSYRKQYDPVQYGDTLDSSRSKSVRNWVAAYPTTLGGKMSVRYERMTNFDLRVQILSDGYDLTDEELEKVDMSGVSSGLRKYYLDQNKAGNIIWKATFDTREGGTSDHISLDVEKPMYAEILMLNSTDTGSYTYSFGNMITLAYENTNSDDNSLVRPYKGVGEGTQLKLPNVVAVNGVQGSQKYTMDNWKIFRNGLETDLDNTNLPGNYTMKVGMDTEFATYGYYNDSERIVAWQPAQDYQFKITKGELRYGAQTTTSKDWLRNVIFELTMDNAEDFDIIKYQRNGSFVENGDPLEFFNSEFRREGSSAILETSTLGDSGNWGTGKNGMAYSFAAYKYDDSAKQYILVAETTESRVVKVDREAPEMSEIEYYYLDSNNGKHEIYEEDLKTWRKERVVAEFDVSDNNKSGINIATTIPGVTTNVVTETGYHVTVLLSTSEERVLTYTDRCGNSVTKTLQAYVDAVTPLLNYTGIFYSEGSHGYSTGGAKIQYQPFFGSSDWYLEYSYEKDANGDDIWHTGEDKMVGSGSTRTFVVNWNMGSINPRKPADFKMRMVNAAGLYNPVYMTGNDKNGKPIVGGLVGSFIISYKYANIYVDVNLGAMIVKGGEFDGRSVKELLASGDAQAIKNYFYKTYDSTDAYRGNAEFEIDLSDNNLSNPKEEGTYDVGVLYTAAYVLKPQPFRPTKAKVSLVYDDSAAGNRNLLVSAYLEGEDADRYDIYFSDNSAIDFNDIYTTVPQEKASANYPIKAKIDKKYFDIDLTDKNIFNSIYEYGNDIPTQIEVAIPDTQDSVTVKLSTNAKKGEAVGNNYGVSGEVITDVSGNMSLKVISGTIAIVPRPVAIDVRFDGSSDIPTSVNAGTSPKFTAFYQDVNGATNSASIKLKFGDKEMTELLIRELGQYEIIVTIPDPNYTIKDGYLVGNEYVQDGTFRFFFNVNQGRLALGMGTFSAEYTGAGIRYDVNAPEDYDGDLIDVNKLDYTYYEYLPGAIYDASNKSIKGEYDKNKGTSEKPVNIGYYHVQVKFGGNAAFLAETFDGDLVITKASTVLSVDRELGYSYLETKFRTFDLREAQTQVKTVNAVDGARQLLWTSANEDHLTNGLIKVSYFDAKSSSYVEVSDSSLGNGWYREIGTYSYKIEYAGNDFYQPCELVVTMKITPAILEGIKLEGGKVVFDGKNHGDVFKVTNPYDDLKIEYVCLAKKYNSIQEIEFINARTYVLFMNIKKEGFQDLTLTANLEIEEAEMTGVSAAALVATYDGTRKDVKFNGLREENGNYYYNSSKITFFTNGGDLGNIYAVNAGKYPGEVTLSAANYKDLKLTTYIEIAQKEVEVKSVRNILPAKVPSGVNMSQYTGAYTLPDGKEIGCYLSYFDEKGEEVKLNDDGTIADGKYTVRLFVDNNHFIDREWTVVVGKVNSAELSAMGIVAVAVVACVMIAAIVTSVVVVKKRKENEII